MIKSKNNIKLSKIFVVLAFFCFGYIIYRLGFLTNATKIDGINIKEFAEDRSFYSATIPAERGTIYDLNGEVLARNVSSYTMIAYLDASISEGESKTYHVVDKEKTAKELATVINMDEEDILDILNQEGLYQVEFGYAGKNLTELEKDKIKSLNLSGIDFMENIKRYYPNGDFASYAIGYAKLNEKNKLMGELGLEALLNEQLSGTDGSTSYQTDVNGRKIAGTREITVDAINGSNIYLTIDANIQYFIEKAIISAESKYKYEWMTIVVADAKTGEILGTAQSPSYDPNILDIENYIDITVSEPYEPGSIMKIYTYMAAMEAGTYDGNATFMSGSYKVDDDTTIYDWDRNGWGKITYDQGFLASSNVGVINIMNNFIDKKTLQDYFKTMGFGEKTGITLANEQSGKISFTYESEIYNAAFGQGVTTTPLQHIQALTSIANDGVMIKPYIISKVTDEQGKIIYEGTREEIRTVASHKTIEKLKDLMYEVVSSSWSAATGKSYYVKGYNLIGKTGTSQLVNFNTGEYYTDSYNTIKTFVGMWPKEDPEVIVYASVKKSLNGSYPLTTTVKNLVQNISKYLNINGSFNTTIIENYKVENFLNKKTSDVELLLKEKDIKYLVLGAGDKIINQYPEKSYELSSNESVILLTNDEYTMPNIEGYSKKEVRAICSLLNLDCVFQDYGYASSSSIKEGSKLKGKEKLTITFKELYKTS